MDTIKATFSIKKFIDAEELYDLNESGHFFDSQKKPISKGVDFNLYLNGVKINGYICYFSILKSLSPNAMLGFREKKYGILPKESSLYILNSICKIPQDEGIEKGVIVRRKNNTVIWEIPDEETQKRFKKDRFVFEEQEYLKLQDDILRFLNNNVDFDIITNIKLVGCSKQFLQDDLEDFAKKNPDSYKEIY